MTHVWAVYEMADYTTVALFATEDLARRFCEREIAHTLETYARMGMEPSRWMLNGYSYASVEVQETLPDPVWKI